MATTFSSSFLSKFALMGRTVKSFGESKLREGRINARVKKRFGSRENLFKRSAQSQALRRTIEFERNKPIQYGKPRTNWNVGRRSPIAP